ncbi:hypothetical protein FMJ29_08455 [Klebsiella michiganensis]|uniref:hypothetical protein n=1 Tax=Klebsiella michiganensis TaxID=1134687 RepID=UPI001CCEFA8B|nr:hypothetical protein [Klebsiella michiganensis]MBZ7458998.1 hypothetical protein [Klebsiella michiganensis]
MESHNFERLQAHILSLSVSDNFEVARKEWNLHSIEISEEMDNCPCGQEIKEHCYIENKRNGNTTYVGNVCINRFMEISTGTLFDGLKRIKKNIFANANKALIEYADQKGYLYDRDYGFLIDTMNQRKLSDKQKAWKERINTRILKEVVVKNRTNR